MLSRCLVLLCSSLPFLSASLSSPHVISLPLIRHTYDRMPNPHEIHTMAAGTQVSTQGCAVNNFFTPVQFGFNQYRLTVDTIMATSAIADATCTNCGVTPLYLAGPTAMLQPGTLTQTYPNGKGWKGISYTDDITIPGQTTIPKVNIGFGGVTSQVGNFFPSGRCDGLNSTYNNNQGTLGLGPPTTLLPGTAPFFDTVRTATTPPIDPIISFQMCSVGGRLWLGGFNTTFMIDVPPSFTQLVGTNSYGVIITDMQYGGVTTGISSTAFGSVVIDTTTTNMLFPQPVYNTIVGLITANPDFVAAFGPTFFSDGVCITPKTGASVDSLNAILPHLLVQMGTQVKLDMQPISSYIREFITLQNTQTGITDTKRYCPGIGVSPVATTTLLGWTFLNQFTTIIDRLNVRVGFSRTSNCGGFVAADNQFINLPAATTNNTPTPFTQTPAFIGIIVVVVVVGIILLIVAVYFGRRYYNSTEYKSRMSSLNYTTSSPNVKVQFADPVVGSKGFMGAAPGGQQQQEQPLTRNAASSASSLNAPGRNGAYSAEQDGEFTDSPLAGSPLGNAMGQTEMSRMPQQQQRGVPPRAMVAQRGMASGAPMQQQQQQQQWGGQQQQQQQWGGQRQQQQWGGQARNSQQVRNPGQLSTPEQPPPRKVYGGVGGGGGGGGGRGAPSEWVEAYDQEGTPYYYNPRTQETTWDRPPNFGRN